MVLPLVSGTLGWHSSYACPTFLLRSLYQLTWQSPRAWVYPIDRFEAASLVSTPLLDGWGITNDGAHLILGNSSAILSWVEPGSCACCARCASRTRAATCLF